MLTPPSRPPGVPTPPPPAARLATLDDVRLQRLHRIANLPRGFGVVETAAWVAAQRAAGRFRGAVYGPIGAEIRVVRPDLAHYLEAHMRDAFATFVVEHRCAFGGTCFTFWGG